MAEASQAREWEDVCVHLGSCGGRLEFLQKCIVGRVGGLDLEVPERERIQQWAKRNWGIQVDLNVLDLNRAWFLFELPYKRKVSRGGGATKTAAVYQEAEGLPETGVHAQLEREKRYPRFGRGASGADGRTDSGHLNFKHLDHGNTTRVLNRSRGPGLGLSGLNKGYSGSRKGAPKSQRYFAHTEQRLGGYERNLGQAQKLGNYTSAKGDYGPRTEGLGKGKGKLDSAGLGPRSQ
ncbi:hypothetical protein F0562_012496 [Nyssa sinensis]|uniref:DUF4283 domain-containing protein n=1 Tax=Nyssa sinensis TaxID=561372 RepID=A0A5J4ZVA9_9ASTE|nr:hypothetical protein F0562_012496 [Nyssa sinensis]